MGTAAHDYRKALVRKLWRDPYMSGWVSPWWNLTNKDRAAIAFWRKRGFVEDDGLSMRLTETGREHYGARVVSSSARGTND